MSALTHIICFDVDINDAKPSRRLRAAQSCQAHRFSFWLGWLTGWAAGSRLVSATASGIRTAPTHTGDQSPLPPATPASACPPPLLGPSRSSFMAGAAIAAPDLSLLQFRPPRTPSHRLFEGPAEQRPSSPRHQACRRRSRGVRRAPGARPLRAGHLLPPPSPAPSALLCGGRRAAVARGPGAGGEQRRPLSEGAGSGAGLQGGVFLFFQCLRKEKTIQLVRTSVSMSRCLLFASVGQASARIIASVTWTLFSSLLTHRLVLLCVDAHCFIFWDLPGDVLAAPDSALRGWIGPILLSLSRV